MLLLANTTDKIQLITGSPATVDVHASFMDSTNADPPVVKGSTSGRQHTAITTATTTDVVAAPAASTLRNVKTLHIRNKHATAATDVTVAYNQNGTSFELHRATVGAGEALEYVEGIGFFLLEPNALALAGSGNTADQTANAADTYIAGSAFPITGRIQAGSFFRWWISATKTAAGVATPIWSVRVGTAGTTADTARVTLTGVAQTAAADTALFLLQVNVRAIGASGILSGTYGLTAHRLAATGFAGQAIDAAQATSATHDLTVANSIIGLSVNPGAAGVWTIKDVGLDAVNLLT